MVRTTTRGGTRLPSVGDIVAFVLVGLAAVGVAAAVYGITSDRGASMRGRLADSTWRTRLAPSSEAESFPADATPSPGGGARYLPVVASGSSWQTRLIGIVGIVLMVSVGAVLLAVSVYVGGSMLVRILTNATHTG